MNIKKALERAYAFGMYQHRREIEDLVNLLVEQQVSRIIEIGSHRGGTAVLWCEIASDLVAAVDLPDGPWGGIGVAGADERDRLVRELYPQYRPVRGNSQELKTWQKVSDLLGPTPVQFLFIDGDHSYEGVSKDFENYRGLVRPGGLIAFHDVIHTERHTKDGVEVPRFWDELVQQYPDRTRLISDNQG